MSDSQLLESLGSAVQTSFNQQDAPLNQTFEQQQGISGAFKDVVHTTEGSCTGTGMSRACTIPLEEDAYNKETGTLEDVINGPIS